MVRFYLLFLFVCFVFFCFDDSMPRDVTAPAVQQLLRQRVGKRRVLSGQDCSSAAEPEGEAGVVFLVSLTE